MSVPDEVLRARAFLTRVVEPGDVRVWSFVSRVGPVEAAAAIRSGSATGLGGEVTAARVDGADPGADLEAAARHGIRLVVPESADWPHFAFAALEHAARELAGYGGPRRRSESGDPAPPLALWVRGPLALSDLGMRSAGIVGARAATPYGEHVASDLAHGLAGRGVVVVSGGAYGIDAAAHRAALAAGGPTVLVSAGGLDRPYPAGNTTLYDRIAASGVLVSESPPGCAPQRRRFLTRNRLIAAFSTGVVVVEAARRSGATNTAAHARLLGRPVMAVPGPVTSAMSVGCHELLRRVEDPALLVTCVDEVLAVVGSPGEGLDTPGDPTRDTGRDLREELDALPPVLRAVFEGLPARRFAAAEEIARRGGVGALDVIRSLGALELAGLAETTAAGARVARRVRERGGAR